MREQVSVGPILGQTHLACVEGETKVPVVKGGAREEQGLKVTNPDLLVAFSNVPKKSTGAP